MKVSYRWLNEYFDGALSKPEELAEKISLHSFEVESVEKEGEDFILDIDVLPNRAHDALSYWGIAKEVAVILDKNIKIPNNLYEVKNGKKSSDYISLEVEDAKLVKRAMKRVVFDIEVKESPDWLKEKIKSQGGKPKNNIVDITNLVMWETGQPVHAFDLDKIEEGKIIIRKAKEGESITTLDNIEYKLNSEALVIADSKKPLDIAGIKGGASSGIDENTKNIVLSICNFDGTNIRKTSRFLDLRTDASKRFEGVLSPALAEVAMNRLSFLIEEIAKGEVCEELLDNFEKGKIRGVGTYKIGASLNEINKVLGTSFKDEEILGILDRMKKYASFSYSKVIPRDLLDQVIVGLLDKPYKYGASITYDAPDFFDCSSFTAYVFAQLGIAIPRMTADQFLYGKEVNRNSLEVGDVVFSKGDSGGREYIDRLGKEVEVVHSSTKDFLPGTRIPTLNHGGIYLGDGKIAHASGNWHVGKVVIEDLDSSPAFKNIVGIRRFISNGEERYVVSIPQERLDLRSGPGFMVSGNTEDLIEEIGRVSGFYRLKSKKPSSLDFSPKVNKKFYYIEKIKDILTQGGFDEVMTYSFRNKGEFELRNALATDKNYLRESLEGGLTDSIDFNSSISKLLGIDYPRIFEIGNVFKNDDEYTQLGIASLKIGEASEVINKIPQELGGNIEYRVLEKDNKNMSIYLNIDKYLDTLPDIDSYTDIQKVIVGDKKFIPISPYPFIYRDISFWAARDIEEGDIVKFIKDNLRTDLVKRIDIIDVYKKDDKTSYAVRVVFQSDDRTLTDDEVNILMDSVYEAVQNRGWEVR